MAEEVRAVVTEFEAAETGRAPLGVAGSPASSCELRTMLVTGKARFERVGGQRDDASPWPERAMTALWLSLRERVGADVRTEEFSFKPGGSDLDGGTFRWEYRELLRAAAGDAA